MYSVRSHSAIQDAEKKKKKLHRYSYNEDMQLPDPVPEDQEGESGFQFPSITISPAEKERKHRSAITSLDMNEEDEGGLENTSGELNLYNHGHRRGYSLGGGNYDGNGGMQEYNRTSNHASNHASNHVSNHISFNQLTNNQSDFSRSPIHHTTFHESPIHKNQSPTHINFSQSPIHRTDFNHTGNQINFNHPTTQNSGINQNSVPNQSLGAIPSRAHRGHGHLRNSSTCKLAPAIKKKRPPLSAFVRVDEYVQETRKDQTVCELPVYPIPDLHEVLQSISKSQKKGLFWCSMQFLLALLCSLVGLHGAVHCLQTLSHIEFFDAFGNLLSVSVCMMSNFDVWRHPSLRFPFGLGRIEVLLAFSLSVSLAFVGVDLLSHVVEHLITILVIGSVHHESGDHITAVPISSTFYYALVILVVILSFVSSNAADYAVGASLKDQSALAGNSSRNVSASSMTSNSDEIRTQGGLLSLAKKASFMPLITGKHPSPVNAKRLSSVTLEAPRKEPFFNSWLNPAGNGINACTKALTCFYAVYCLVYPAVVSDEKKNGEWVDNISTFGLSALILTFGCRLVDRLGNTLLMKSPPESLKLTIIRNIQQLDFYRAEYRIREFVISRVDQRIFVIILKISIPGASDDDEAKFRFYATRVIRGLMHQYTKGLLAETSQKQLVTPEPDRKSIVALLNVDSNTFGAFGSAGEDFEITIDVDRS
ncbi:hypothetical protein HII13_003905 [Brettanomyces bruxellensis]|nr:hypothetical protein HII13_003905 [Brettanomyces bruxellensis]